MREMSSRLPTTRLRCSASSSIAWANPCALGLRPGHVLLAQTPGRGHDRRQRRPQVVRDRVQHRGPQAIGPPQDLGLGRLGSEPVALDRLAELRRRGREQPVLDGRERRPARTSEQQRPHARARRRESAPGAPPARGDAAAGGVADDAHPAARGRVGLRRRPATGPRCSTRAAPAPLPVTAAQAVDVARPEPPERLAAHRASSIATRESAALRAAARRSTAARFAGRRRRAAAPRRRGSPLRARAAAPRGRAGAGPRQAGR